MSKFREELLLWILDHQKSFDTLPQEFEYEDEVYDLSEVIDAILSLKKK